MASGENIKTYFNGTWHDGDKYILRAADHGAWLGSSVFDGARFFEGATPDLLLHCERVNNSAKAMMLDPAVTPDEMVEIIKEGLSSFDKSTSVYIRPMYWALDGAESLVLPKENSTAFSICLEQIPMASATVSATLSRTKFRRPVLEDNVVNAKAGCLYPNNARMLAEARSKGFTNALVADAAGNVAETATANIFMVRDGEVLTPIPNGTFLAGITRARHIQNLREYGKKVSETVLTFQDFEEADEVFMTGNMTKITPVTAFEYKNYQVGSIAKLARELYWDWSRSQTL
ncbi:branched-chain amino acid aminotransferase [Paracoccaceae bacterium]|nr:branched-chain amino acid aminotransferase [Paracoccaceae bacterium]